ncbi:hypothetical protein EV385_1084 [Krasilnikovia cinnamomea]|uniref:Uncharacterized protein n=1 Tax=Krasilnikovia cinnamomea TaxID=349313 RepID=A0A4Q7ZGZ8_9ACTN|nr:hypothetical protein [Krasilnikovia cinnamomea]RZU49339.1 hypothetical protein EV385_1084 [Krasilnikovia cinnamomea]
MLNEHNTHAEVGHLGFTLDANPADDLYDPPVPSTAVTLYGPIIAVTMAALTLHGTPGVVIVDLDTPQPCSLMHGCVIAGLVLDGHIAYQALRDAISAVFGPPADVEDLSLLRPINPHLN